MRDTIAIVAFMAAIVCLPVWFYFGWPDLGGGVPVILMLIVFTAVAWLTRRRTP